MVLVRDLLGDLMDLFKFVTTNSDGYISQGEIINGYDTLEWTERYVLPGEFKLKAPVSSGLRSKLPPGTMVSHVDTLELMYVTSNEIDTEAKEGEPPLVITGRSMESWLRHRIVGDDIETYIDIGTGYHLVNSMADYVLAFDSSWDQARDLINALVNTTFAGVDDEVEGFVAVSNQQHIGPNTVEPRIMRKQNLHSAVLELLAVDDFGIKSVRPNPTNVDPTTVEFRIHNGFDLRESVRFSHALGDLDRTRYFWSDEGYKTDFYCVSNYFQLRSAYSAVGLDRRIMIVDCTDMDNHYTDEEMFGVGSTLPEEVGIAMDIRGQQMLRAQVPTAIASTDISQTTQYKYREDYDVGDIVHVSGDYDLSAVMRVMEYVEFEDELGEHGYPTLAAVNEVEV
jgi:hypothetical protein